MKKILVIGGTKGLGRAIAQYFGGMGIGRRNGFDIETEFDRVETLSSIQLYPYPKSSGNYN